jgi:tripartite-type tricarboxylate transporter receptor subunit TctC
MNICRAAACLLVLSAATATASAEDFYKGKTLTIIVGFTPGGGFDLNARLLSRHIAKHIPGNPNIIVQNMPGAAGLKSVLYVDAVAPKDGTVIDTFNFGNISDSRLVPEKVKVDFRKYAWVGSIAEDLTVCYAWHAVGVKTIAEAKARGMVMGLTATGSSSDVNQRILREIFGVPVKQVAGYPGSAEERLAVERGELDGDCGSWPSLPAEWIDTHKIVPIIKSSEIDMQGLPPGVPYSVAIAPNDHDRAVIKLLVASGKLGRPFIAAGAVPAERLQILRQAFNDTMKDPQFLADAEKLRMPVSPKNADEGAAIVNEIYATPEDIVQAARKVAGEQPK